MNAPETPEHYRLFVALPVPAEVKTTVEQAQAELRRAVGSPGIRWATRQQFHLTLRFLGDVEVARVDSLVAALRAAGTGFAPLQMHAKGVGFFPNARYPRVVWVGVQDRAERLGSLQLAIQAATAPFTAEKEETRFSGHVTLGRIKGLRRPDTEALAQTASTMAARVFGDWVAPELELIRSQLSPHGSTYTCLSSIPLIEHFT
jgi:RNA 2',3'-cyclic 3'-phosphodiesterase